MYSRYTDYMKKYNYTSVGARRGTKILNIPYRLLFIRKTKLKWRDDACIEILKLNSSTRIKGAYY